MEYIERVQFSEADEDLDEDVPDLLFIEEVLPLFLLDDFLVQVAIICELHNDAGIRRQVPEAFALQEDFLVADDGGVFYGGQNANFIERILDLLFGEVSQFHFL